jgi:hypothetical protein
MPALGGYAYSDTPRGAAASRFVGDSRHRMSLSCSLFLPPCSRSCPSGWMMGDLASLACGVFGQLVARSEYLDE